NRATCLGWRTPATDDPPEDAVVIYPEVISGNPLRATRVVRWALNYPGKLAGDTYYDQNEMAFAWDARMLGRVSQAAAKRLDERRVLTVPLVDPEYIFPDERVPKDVDAYFVYKGRSVRERFVLPNEREMVCIDEHTATQRDLGHLLRRTRTLYSYDHATLL